MNGETWPRLVSTRQAASRAAANTDAPTPDKTTSWVAASELGTARRDRLRGLFLSGCRSAQHRDNQIRPFHSPPRTGWVARTRCRTRLNRPRATVRPASTASTSTASENRSAARQPTQVQLWKNEQSDCCSSSRHRSPDVVKSVTLETHTLATPQRTMGGEHRGLIEIALSLGQISLTKPSASFAIAAEFGKRAAQSGLVQWDDESGILRRHHQSNITNCR